MKKEQKVFYLPKSQKQIDSIDICRIVDDWRTKYDLYGSLWEDRIDELKDRIIEKMSKNI